MIQYSIKRNPRAKNLRVSVYADGTCVVSAHTLVPESVIKKFVADKSGWISEKLKQFMPFRPLIRAKDIRANYIKHKESARALVLRDLPELNRAYGFTYHTISIRNQRSRWGSCSARGNLNFNYKILFLPPHLARYLMVHELCHLGECNHSQKFWDLVSRTIPNYQDVHKELQRYRISIG